MNKYLVMDGWPEMWSFVEAETHEEAWEKHLKGGINTERSSYVVIVALGEEKKFPVPSTIEPTVS